MYPLSQKEHMKTRVTSSKYFKISLTVVQASIPSTYMKHNLF